VLPATPRTGAESVGIGSAPGAITTASAKNAAPTPLPVQYAAYDCGARPRRPRNGRSNDHASQRTASDEFGQQQCTRCHFEAGARFPGALYRNRTDPAG